MTSAFDILKNARRGIGRNGPPRPQGTAGPPPDAPRSEQAAPVAVHTPDIPPPFARMRREPTIYRELMKKHDRLGNRHIPGK